jgi:NADH pyrophosphatase NudC (nudix superfamily)
MFTLLALANSQIMWRATYKFCLDHMRARGQQVADPCPIAYRITFRRRVIPAVIITQWNSVWKDQMCHRGDL